MVVVRHRGLGIVGVAIFLLMVVPANPRSVGAEHQEDEQACAWAGIYPTVLTPFCNGGVDVPSLQRQIHYQLGGGVRGLLVLGTIGEGQYVTSEERAVVIATAVHAAAGLPVIAGIHTCAWETARSQMLQARDLGASAALVKFVGDPQASADTVLAFYTALCDLHALPILYYHYPSQTGLKLSPADIARILGLPGMVGIKESTLNLREVKAHRCLTQGQDKVFLSGTALNLTQFMELGGHGAMCPEAALMPGATARAYACFRQGRKEAARSIQSDLFAITPVLRSRPTPPTMARIALMSAEDHQLPVPMGRDEPQARLKATLNCLGIPTSPQVKCPLPPLTPREAQRVKTVVNQIRWIECHGGSADIPPEPMHVHCVGNQWGGLLRTGAFQLGSGVSKDLLRFQGDGTGF